MDEAFLSPRFALDRRDALVFLLLLAWLLAVYSGVLLIPYGFLDDYTWLDLARHNQYAIYVSVAAQGRPLNGILMAWMFHLCGDLKRLVWVRAISIVGIAGMGWMLYWAAARSGWSRGTSAFLAALGCMTPPMQVYAAWATMAPVLLSGILAAAAAMGTARALDRRSRGPAFFAAAILLLLSASIYQPTAMIFWPIAGLDLFRRDRALPAILRRGAVYFLVALIGLGLSGAVLALGIREYPSAIQPGRGGFTHEPLDKMARFIHDPLVDSLELFLIHHNPQLAIAAATVIFVGLFFHLRGTRPARLIGVVLAATLLPLGYMPSLLAQVDEWSYRTQIGLSWSALVLLAIAMDGIRRALGLGRIAWPVPVLLTILAGAVAAYNATALIAWPQAFEQALLRIELSRPDVRAARRIILLQPTLFDSPAPHRRYDEFGFPTLAEISTPQPAIDLIRRELDRDPPPVHVKQVPDYKGTWTRPPPPGTALIDMRVLRDAR